MRDVSENIELIISDDGLEASLVLQGESGTAPSLDSIVRILNKHGVVFGIHKENLDKLVSQGFQTNDPVRIATGIPPVTGLDAEILFCFRKEFVEVNALPQTEFKGDGKYHLTNCKIAKKNEVLAVKLRKTDGKHGKDVFGKEIPAFPGQDCILEAGKNIQTRYYPDKIEYSALCEGIVRLEKNRLEINSLCIIDHDVDLSTGNIDFVGNLLILGNVHKGFKVSSQGSIKVQGNVSGAVLQAAGDISIGGSVSGSCDLRSGGKIIADFIEHSKLEALGDVISQNGILHCEIICGGVVRAVKGQGLIAGGKVKARNGVETKSIGSDLGTITEISIGEEYVENRQSLRLEARLNRLEDEIQRLQAILRPYSGKDLSLSEFPSDKKWALKKLVNQLKEKRIERKNIQQKLATFNEMAPMHEARLNKIKAQHCIFKGTKIRIGQKKMQVDENLTKVVVFLSPTTGEIAVADAEN